MPRELQEILDQADELAVRFENHEPDEVRVADVLRDVRQAFVVVTRSQQTLVDAVTVARAEGHSWAAIGAMLGTSAYAARQQYGNQP